MVAHRTLPASKGGVTHGIMVSGETDSPSSSGVSVRTTCPAIISDHGPLVYYYQIKLR